MAQDTLKERIALTRQLIDRIEAAASSDPLLMGDYAFDQSLWGAEVELKGALDRVGKAPNLVKAPPPPPEQEFRNTPTQKEIRRITVPIVVIDR